MALDSTQILKKIFDSTNNCLRATDNTPATVPQPAVKLSAEQVWKRVYNSSTNKIRLVST